MGAYDQLLPSSGQYISTYAGSAIEETAALGDVLTKNFERGMQGVSAYNVMRNNVDVLDADESMKDKIFDESYKGLEEYAKRGDYENAIPAIINATTMVSGDKNLKDAMAAKVAVGKFKERLDKRLDSGDIEKWQYDNAISRLSDYQGIASDDAISNHTGQPAKAVDIRSLMEDAAKTVRPETVRGKPKWNSQLGKYEITEVKTYDPVELRGAMGNSLNNPAAQEYLNEMRSVYGDEFVQDMIMENEGAIGSAMYNVDPSVSYQTPSKFAGGAPGGSGGGGGGGTLNVLPIGKEEGVDYIQAGEDIEWDRNVTFEDRAAMRDKINKNSGGFWNNLGNSLNAMWNDIPTNEEIESYNKISDSARNYNDIPQATWDAYSSEQREELTKEYVNGAGKFQHQLNITSVDAASEIKSRNLPDTADGWSNAKIGAEIAKDIKNNSQSRVFYDLKEQEVVEQGKDDSLSKALAGEKGYNMTVLGDADARNMYGFSAENKSLSSSYVIKVDTPEGTKNYMVSKDERYQRSSSASLPGVSNREYNTKVSEIFNTFPAPSYTDSYEDDNGVSFTGERSKENMNIVVISNLKNKDGDVNLEVLAKQINAGLDTPIVHYNPDTGELYGFDDNQIAKLVLQLGYN